MEIFMTFNSFLKSPLFFGLSLSIGSGIFIRVLGLGLFTNIISTVAIAALYTFFSYRKEFSRSFKLWTISASILFNTTLGLIFNLLLPLSKDSVASFARSATRDQAFNQFLEKTSSLPLLEQLSIYKAYAVGMFLKWYSELGLAIIPVMLLIIALLIAIFILTSYLPITIGNKLGLRFLKNQSEK